MLIIVPDLGPLQYSWVAVKSELQMIKLHRANYRKFFFEDPNEIG